ncbi:MAG: tryptophan-rich sensory protein [Planctomycetia bacterium]|nr:tryptophan-rich sensory protein [Planctomycetia bacterium]
MSNDERKNDWREKIEHGLDNVEEKIESAEHKAAEVGHEIGERARTDLEHGKEWLHDKALNAEERAERLANRIRDEIVEEARSCAHGCDADHCFCQDIFPWLGFLGITYAAGWVSSLFVQNSSHEWFKSLNLPMWAPPMWIYVPVWILLFFLLGTAVWCVWKKAGCRKISHIIALYVFFLLLNIGWTYTFFYNENIFGGFITTIWLFAVSVLMPIAMAPICRLASVLMLPQVIWVLYAMLLNYSIWRLN